MSNQSKEGWYPECEICECGNLEKVICWDCYQKRKKEIFKNIYERNNF